MSLPPELAQRTQWLWREVARTREARLTPLPNEMAFFVALGLGGFQVQHVVWHGHGEEYLNVITESKDQRRRNFLKETLGTRGAIEDRTRWVRVELELPQFSFLEKPSSAVTQQFLKDKNQFAPFLACLCCVQVGDKLSRIVLEDGKLLEQIRDVFPTHYGFDLGHIEKRKGRSPALVIDEPAKVIGALLKTDSVASLPFKHALKVVHQERVPSLIAQ